MNEPPPRFFPSAAGMCFYLGRLPWHRRDPYDRILIAQSVAEEMALVTADGEIRKYGITIRAATA